MPFADGNYVKNDSKSTKQSREQRLLEVKYSQDANAMEEVSSMQTGQIYTKQKRENKEPIYKEAYHKPTEKSI